MSCINFVLFVLPHFMILSLYKPELNSSLDAKYKHPTSSLNEIRSVVAR